MQQALEGSQAIARAVARCRPQVVSAYPITPQTHIVENIAKLVADGEFDCEMVSVESEFSAASVVLGAVAAGSRAYTASASQGILLMMEVLYNIAGMRLPAVMTCANRAVSAPLSIWNDQQDSMAARDAGWIQIYCADNQEAVDTTIQSFRIAELTELPVMVCMDGFTLTHTLERLDVPEQETVDAFLPPFRFPRALDPRQPLSMGTLVSPDHFSEARHAHHEALLRALPVIEQVDEEWAAASGRRWGGLVEADGPEEARIGLLILGSIHGTLWEARERTRVGPPVRLIKLRAFRPFPTEALRRACAGLDTLVVLERALSPGGGGILGAEVRGALYGQDEAPRVLNYAIGLGGRDVPLDLYARILEAAGHDEPAPFRIFDLEPERLEAAER